MVITTAIAIGRCTSFCGRHLLAARLRLANIDGAAGATQEVARLVRQIREHWPEVEVVLRAGSGFCREELMAWCEGNGVHSLFGLARNARLLACIKTAPRWNAPVAPGPSSCRRTAVTVRSPRP